MLLPDDDEPGPGSSINRSKACKLVKLVLLLTRIHLIAICFQLRSANIFTGLITFVIICKKRYLDCDWSISVHSFPKRSAKMCNEEKVQGGDRNVNTRVVLETICYHLY